MDFLVPIDFNAMPMDEIRASAGYDVSDLLCSFQERHTPLFLGMGKVGA